MGTFPAENRRKSASAGRRASIFCGQTRDAAQPLSRPLLGEKPAEARNCRASDSRAGCRPGSRPTRGRHLARPAGTVPRDWNQDGGGVDPGPRRHRRAGPDWWTSTAICVRHGERVTCNATGRIRLAADQGDLAGPVPAANRTADNAVIPDRSDAHRPCRKEPAIRHSDNSGGSSAGLLLGIDDDHHADTSGGLRVQVEGGRFRRIAVRGFAAEKARVPAGRPCVFSD